MRRNIAASGLSIGICILLLMTVFTNLGFAQGEEAPQQSYKFSYFQVKPGMALEFEEFVKSLIPALKKMGATEMTIYKTSNFGMADKYVAVTPLQDPAAMDAELSESQSSVPVALISALSAISRMVVSTQDFMLIPQPDLNIPPDEGYEHKLVVYLTIGTAPGREGDFKKGLKEVVDAIGKTDVKGVLIGKVGVGGNLNEYIMYLLYDSFKEMASNSPAVQKELAAADLTSLETGVVYYMESEVLVRVPELCIQPAAQ
jgi:hypothetical protein